MTGENAPYEARREEDPRVVAAAAALIREHPDLGTWDGKVGSLALRLAMAALDAAADSDRTGAGS